MYEFLNGLKSKLKLIKIVTRIGFSAIIYNLILSPFVGFMRKFRRRSSNIIVFSLL